MDPSDVRSWIGRTDARADQVTPAPIAALAATLDRDEPFPEAGDPLPPLWHWLYFLPIHRASEQDIVYRSGPVPGASPPPPEAAPNDAVWRREVRPDEVLLFRYSALTLNGHHIHYDRRYATEVEGYPGLVVHGPLIATMLLELLRQNLRSAVVTEFSCRAVRPIFDVAPSLVCGRRDTATAARLWAADAEGALAMHATATLA